MPGYDRYWYNMCGCLGYRDFVGAVRWLEKADRDRYPDVDRIRGHLQSVIPFSEIAARERLAAWTRRRAPKVLHGLHNRLLGAIRAKTTRLNEASDRLLAMPSRMKAVWRAHVPRALVDHVAASMPDVAYRCKPKASDFKLIREWGFNEQSSKAEKSRLLCARLGEQAAALYYGRMGHDVADVSIRQLSHPGGDWTTHDLVVDGLRLDVKNIRCTRVDQLGEHYWPDHKKDRSGTDVSIVGVVTMLDDDGSEPATSQVVLGKVSDGEIHDLRGMVNRMSRRMDIPVHIDEMNDWQTRIPGWLFEYSDHHYQMRWEVIIRRVRDSLDSLALATPPWLCGFSASRLGVPTGSAGQSGVAHSLARFFRVAGLSKRTLFWFVLLFMLRTRGNPARAAELSDHVFIDQDTGRYYPLGLHDPRCYIWHLIRVMRQIIASNERLLDTVSNYRVRAVNTLQAQMGDGVWRTILARCSNCGRWPIYLADAKQNDDTVSKGVTEGRFQHSGASLPCPCERKRLVCCGCYSCGIRDCDGHVFNSQEDADAAARRLCWVRTGRSVKQPSSRYRRFKTG